MTVRSSLVLYFSAGIAAAATVLSASGSAGLVRLLAGAAAAAAGCATVATVLWQSRRSAEAAPPGRGTAKPGPG